MQTCQQIYETQAHKEKLPLSLILHQTYKIITSTTAKIKLQYCLGGKNRTFQEKNVNLFLIYFRNNQDLLGLTMKRAVLMLREIVKGLSSHQLIKLQRVQARGSIRKCVELWMIHSFGVKPEGFPSSLPRTVFSTSLPCTVLLPPQESHFFLTQNFRF